MGCGNSTEGRDLELPQKDSKERLDARKSEIEINKKLYEWVHDPTGSTPSHIKELPPAEKDAAEKKWHAKQVFDIVGQAVTLNINKFFDEISDIWQKDGPFQDYSEIYGPNCERPAIAARWREDVEFARQKLQGVFPTAIYRVRELPAKFPVTEDYMKGVLPDGETLASMLAAGRMYMCDYEFLDGTRAPPERNMCAPLLLFFVSNDKVLMPAAIQLGQNPEKYPIFVPAGDDLISNRWLVARILCNSSEGCLHQVSHHLLLTHLAMEIVYIALKRTTASTHPINQLLGAHFWYTLFINGGARNTLIKDADSVVPKVMAMGYDGMVDLFVKGWKNYSMDVYDIEADFAKRDVNDILNYWYRDDARKVWNCIKNYVRRILREFYLSDEDVVNDTELQAFVAEVVNPKIGNIRGSPFTNGKAENFEQVLGFCTDVIWACTGCHAAYNNGQYDYFGFIPNAPGIFAIAPPAKDAVFTLEQVAAAFPNPQMTVLQVSFIHVLAMGTDQPLGEFTHDQGYMKLEPKCTEHWKAWKKELKTISDEIQARNKTLAVPYTYLDPAQIANSVAI
jgi:hypothetical protein